MALYEPVKGVFTLLRNDKVQAQSGQVILKKLQKMLANG